MITRLLLLCLLTFSVSCRTAKQNTEKQKAKSRLLGGNGGNGGNAQGTKNGENGKDGKGGVNITIKRKD